MTIRTFATVLCVFLCCGAGSALADDAAPAGSLADLDGKDLFRTVCKPCHTADADGGEYTPMTLIMEQWDEVFDALAETHAETACPADDSRKLLDVLDEGMLKELRKFCVDHAADSEQPMTCG